MIYKTFQQIKDKIQMETDTEAEDFVQPQEFIDYVNDGIDEAESEIHKLGLEDEYFLNKGNIALVLGQEDYSLPTDIYANKIRKIIYKEGTNGTSIYTIKRMRGPDKFENRAITNDNSTTQYYQYMIYNPSAVLKPQLLLVPPAQETSATNVVIWYIRNAARWNADATLNCDLPEIAMQFLYAYVEWRIWSKDGTGRQGEAKADMEQARKQMVETLTNMVPDEDSEMVRDLSSYGEMS